MSEDDCTALGGCTDSRIERLYEYLDGALAREDIAEIKAHLDHCPECVQEEEVERVIRTVVRRSCAETAPETLKATIISRITAVRVSR
ncbi:mycothiol system anti-sigma-R factor [Tersicoccus sp. MR15.9]|uniref:mycothiol system anti-sigma-R factor n=1 Tax=Tersicoccus mangrovi TaxID=3121635 RepID=UPI002FE65092